ncbi:putative RNA-binding protein EIF1AD [Vigna unguiculata]|uniref:Putative RNA-binding protein EIF1AD n=1 Tax=Vigna unguiculata TaxID=3917 RepID=A0A4D6NSQ7_VIGUN|nr:putative RNA-binding protein EIF1AD [Vigna unguiculata]
MAMRGGRKNLKRATEEKHVTLQDGQSFMQVVSLRGSNIIEDIGIRNAGKATTKKFITSSTDGIFFTKPTGRIRNGGVLSEFEM